MATVGLVACAAGGIEQLEDGLVQPLLDRGHQVAITLTPMADRWLQADGTAARLAELTGQPVRATSRLPGERSPHPRLDAIVVAPATFNTTAKIALGIADNQALTVATENLTAIPMVLFPRINAAHAAHPAWRSHIAALRAAGAEVIDDPEVWPLYRPREAPPGRRLPWAVILAAATECLN